MSSPAGTTIIEDDGKVALDEEGRELLSDGDSDCDCCPAGYVQASECSGESGGTPPWIAWGNFPSVSGKVVQVSGDTHCYYFDPDSTPVETAGGTVYSPGDLAVFPNCDSCQNACNPPSDIYMLDGNFLDSNYTDNNFTGGIDSTMSPFPITVGIEGVSFGCGHTWAPDFNPTSDEISGVTPPSPDNYAYIAVNQTNPFGVNEVGYRVFDKAGIYFSPGPPSNPEHVRGWHAWILRNPGAVSFDSDRVVGTPFYTWHGGVNADDPTEDYAFDDVNSNLLDGSPSYIPTSPGIMEVSAGP